MAGQTHAGKTIPLVLLLVGAYGALAYLIGANGHFGQLLTVLPIYAVLALSWNVLSGYSGAISFGHAAFFGLGAYTVTLLFKFYDVTPWIGIPAALVVGSASGVLIGIPTFRLRGVYFALAMLAYPLVLRYVFEWLGFQEIAIPMKRDDAFRYMQFSDPRFYILGSLVLLLLAVSVSFVIERSRFGLALLAIKQNEFAAEAAGINVFRSKLQAIAISGAMAAAAGAYYAVVLLVTTPESVFGMMQSAQAMVLTLFGGVGTLWGPLIGAATLVPLGEFLQTWLGDRFPGIHGIVYGAAIVTVILLAPEGLFWKVRDRITARSRTTQRKPRSSPVVEPALPPEPVRHAPAMAANDAPVLRVEGIAKHFGGVRALDGITFDLRRGIILGIIGQNGSGKTTLFNVINGFVRPDSGRVSLAGTAITGLRPDQACRLGLGRTFQVARPFLRMTVHDNVLVGALVSHPTAAEARQASRDALERVGLLEKAEEIAGTLNNLELRLMELARALASRPTVLLLDETLAGLSFQDIDPILKVIRRIPSDGTTVVIIEHTMHAMMRLVDELIVLDQGRLIATGDPQQVVSDPQVIEAYLGRKWVTRRAES